MSPVLNSFLIVFAGACLLVAVYFFVTALRTRAEIPAASYGVERQEARHVILASFMRSGFLFFLALIVVAILGIGNFQESEFTTDDDLEGSLDTLSTPTAQIENSTLIPLSTSQKPTPTSPVATFTTTPTRTPVPTETPVVVIAVVNSPNGLWLREKPGGTQELELISDGSELTVLEGIETVDDLEWRFVRTQTGTLGWVAALYIEIR